MKLEQMMHDLEDSLQPLDKESGAHNKNVKKNPSMLSNVGQSHILAVD